MRLMTNGSKLIKMILLVSLIFLFSSRAFAGTPPPPVIKPGTWSLGDTFELRYGQDDFHTYSYNDLKSLYQKNSSDLQINETMLEINELKYQSYCLEFESLTANINAYKHLISQYRSAASKFEDEMNSSTGAQKDTARQNREQSIKTALTYESEGKVALLQKAEAYESMENCLFIKNNQSTYRNQQYIQDITRFRDRLYYLKTLDEKYDLQGLYTDYYRLKADQQIISKTKDMSFQSDIDIYNSEYDFYSSQQELLKQQFIDEFESLLVDSNINTSKGSIINTEIRALRGLVLYDSSTYDNSCYLNDLKKKQIEDKIRIIDGKISIIKELYPDSSNEVKLLVKEKQITEFELSKWITQRKNLVKSAYTLYKNKYKEIDILEKKTRALYETYIIRLNKYNYGLADRLFVKEAELNYIQSYSDLWKTIYDYSYLLGTVERNISGSIEGK